MAGSVRIGFIGAGGIAGAHIQRLGEVPEAEIVAVCDVDPDRARAVAAPLGAAVHTEGRALIDAERLDALYVCVPPHAHDDLVRFGLGLGAVADLQNFRGAELGDFNDFHRLLPQNLG